MLDHIKRQSINFWLGGLVLLVAALLYSLTLDNGLRPDELTGGDLITHQYAQVEARPSNAPGYPLYTMGGWLWFRLGRLLLGWLFNPIQILSFYSTLWALAALLMLYLILLRVSDQPWWLASLLTLFYATTFFFWYYSVTTEQYTSAVFQTLLLIWLAFKWEADPHDSTLLWLAFVSGTMLTNMVTTLFILPPLLWFIFTRPADPSICHSERPAGAKSPSERSLRNTSWGILHIMPFRYSLRSFTLWVTGAAQCNSQMMLWSYLRRPGLFFQASGAAMLPCLSYAYVYIRGAQHPEWRGAGAWPSTWVWFSQFLTIQQGRDELALGLTTQNFFTTEFPALMWQELTWPIFFGGLLGIAALGKRRAIFLYSTLLIYLIFAWLYRFGNWFQVIIPAYPIFVIGFAAGVRWIIGRGRLEIRDWRFATSKNALRGHLRRLAVQVLPASRPRRWVGCEADALRKQGLVSTLIALFLVGLIIYRFTLSFPETNQHNLADDTGLDPGWAIVADQPQGPALIAVDFAEEVALEYLGVVWGVARQLEPVAPADFSNTARQPISFSYITRRALAARPELAAGVQPQAAGEQLIALSPPLPPTEMVPLEVEFADKLSLIGWEQVQPLAKLPEEVRQRGIPATWQIALYWQALLPLEADYTVSVRPLLEGQLISVAGENLIQDHQPVWGVYPTSRWPPDEIVRDVYALTLPEGLSPDAVQVVVYRETGDGFENLADYTFATK